MCVCVCVCVHRHTVYKCGRGFAKHGLAGRPLDTPALQRRFTPGAGTTESMLQGCLCTEIGLFIMRLGNVVEIFVWECPLGKLWRRWEDNRQMRIKWVGKVLTEFRWLNKVQ